jgi:hypothetical protein
MMSSRHLSLQLGYEDDVARMSLPVIHHIQVRKYFMMNWTEGSVNYDFARDRSGALSESGGFWS